MVQEQGYKSVETFLKLYSESKKVVERWKKRKTYKKRKYYRKIEGIRKRSKFISTKYKTIYKVEKNNF